MKKLLDDERIRIATISFLLGFVLAFIIYPNPEAETVYKFTTKIETDTAYVEVLDTVYVPKTKIKTQVLRDTIVVDFKPQIKAFETTFPFEYGSTKVSGEVLGEVLKMNATSGEKICFKCKTLKPLDLFYRHKAMGDGHLNKCMECTKKDVKYRYYKDFEKVREYKATRYKDPEKKAKILVYQKNRRLKDREKLKARAITAYAIRTGKLVRQPCVKCNNPKSQAHHHDYSRPLDVEWLCFKCHRLEHGQINVLR